VLTGIRTAPDASLVGGEGFSCRLQPFGFAIPFAVRVELVEAPSRLLWVAERWGVHGRGGIGSSSLIRRAARRAAGG